MEIGAISEGLQHLEGWFQKQRRSLDSSQESTKERMQELSSIKAKLEGFHHHDWYSILAERISKLEQRVKAWTDSASSYSPASSESSQIASALSKKRRVDSTATEESDGEDFYD